MGERTIRRATWISLGCVVYAITVVGIGKYLRHLDCGTDAGWSDLTRNDG